MIFKNLTFDGISLKEYGVYISGEAVFDSPTRDVEMVTIPGRNGSFVLDKGRFNNITVTYPAGIYATSQTEFAEKVSTLRNLLASRKGYCRLTDEYNPDEFRLGVYKAGLELDPTHYNEAGRFELSFDCKPQRFLFSGEEVFTLGEWGQTETKSGSIVSFEGDETTAIKSLTAQIVPKQSGSGDPSPSNVRPISGWDSVEVYISPTTSEEGGETITINPPQTVYGGTLDVVSGKLTIDMVTVDLGTLTWNKNTTYNIFTAWLTPTPAPSLADKSGYAVLPNYPYSPNFVLDSSKDKVCEMGRSGYFINNIIIRDTSYADATAFKTAMNGMIGAYKIATPTEIQLTPTEVNTLLGQNNIWADSGDVTVEIGQNPYILVNPTLFEACPLIEFNASGSGEINLGSKKLEFFNSPLGTINLPFTVSTSENTTDTTDTIEFSGSYNAGDKFRVKGSKASFNLTAPSTISSVEFPGGMDLRVNPYESSKNGNNAITTVEDWQETEFTIGTASTVNKTYTPSYVFGGSSHTATFTLSLVYDGDATLLMVWTATLPSGMTLNRITTNSKYTLVCDSTANSLTGDLYIDLDIGEAYKVEDDSITSINNFVNLGGKLPTLDPGATEISTDSSISNVKVTPRWWKV